MSDDIWVMRSPAVRRFAISRVARVPVPERERPRKFSWGHAWAEWNDGTSCERWLRLDDAQHFTEAVTAEIARRLAGRQAQPGAYTPAALFGASLATDVGLNSSDGARGKPRCIKFLRGQTI